MKAFFGIRGDNLQVKQVEVSDCFVWNGSPIIVPTLAEHGDDLPLRLDIANHSPTGFECGYEGSGPAQLALAICAAMDIATVPRIYQTLKRQLVARLPRDAHWVVTARDVCTVLSLPATAYYLEGLADAVDEWLELGCQNPVEFARTLSVSLRGRVKSLTN